MLFSGHENAISLAREYYIDYRCEFDLTFYPFDTQVNIWNWKKNWIKGSYFNLQFQLCEMKFKVQGKTEKYVKLMKDGIGIEFLGTLKLYNCLILI